MLDAFTLLFASLLLQAPLALITSLLVLRLGQLYGGPSLRLLGIAWGLWGSRVALAACGFWLTRSGLPVDAWPRRLTTMAGLMAGYALLPMLVGGTRGLAGRGVEPARVRRWAMAAAAGGALIGIVATLPDVPVADRIRLNLGLLATVTALTLGLLGTELWRQRRDALTAGRQLAALGLWAYAGKQVANLLMFSEASGARNLWVLLGENLVLVLAALGTLALLFERERVSAATASTERIAAEQAALQATAELGSSLESVADPIALAAPDLTLTRANAAFRSLVARLGRGVATPGFPMVQFARPEVRERWLALFQRALRGERVVLKYPLPVDGVERTYNVQLTPVGNADAVQSVLVTLHDVTADEALVREIESRERYYRSLIEQSNDMITVIGLDGITRYASPSVERVLGWKPEALVGQSAIALVHPDDMPTMVAGFGAARHETARRRTYTFRLRRPDGHHVDVEMVTSVFEGDDGERVIIANARDLSDRRALEQELLQAQRLDSLGRLAGGVAHDFNNLLTGMLGHVSFARGSVEDPGALRQELDDIEATARRAAELTRQLLTFARREHIVPKVFDVNTQLQSVTRMLGRLVGDSVRVEARLPDDAMLVRVDPGQFEQAIINLVVNARDAMPEGGVVTIETDLVESAAPLGAVAAVRIRVTDTGVGMDDATRLRVFEPFFTTKQGGRGTGLGLASVYGTVTQAGGHISVDSTPGAGSCFELLFPRHAATPSDVAAIVPLEARGDTRAATVLVAEDDAMVRRIVLKILRKHGYTVLEATDGEEALALWRANADRVELLLTDVQMPRMNGRALARTVATERPELPVVYMSGYDADAVAAVPNAPAGPFVAKPFTEAELLAGIRTALQQD
jgi:PAS domain S-box-containing protein